jgi:hypothetical protein
MANAGAVRFRAGSASRSSWHFTRARLIAGPEQGARSRSIALLKAGTKPATRRFSSRQMDWSPIQEPEMEHLRFPNESTEYRTARNASWMTK